MMSSSSQYSLDTSAFIDGLERYYPAPTFAGLWEAIDTMISNGRLYASEEVWEEIKRKDQAVKEWAEPKKGALFVATDSSITTEVASLLEVHPRLVMSGGRRNRADPFVIALAKLRGATVVTGEGLDGNAQRPKIPFVCKDLGVPCMRFTDLITAEGWTFSLVGD
jgi:hypothetical protein